MNRRDSLRKLVAGTGALIALPAWADHWTASDLSLSSSPFDADEQALLASVVDTIIPPGDSIGALSVGVDKFIEKLLADCYEDSVQRNMKKQLQNLDALATKETGQPFTVCDQKKREALLIRLSTSEVKEEKDFFTLMKSETIRGFNTSKEVMQKYLNYKVAPGHYHGCVDVKA